MAALRVEPAANLEMDVDCRPIDRIRVDEVGGDWKVIVVQRLNISLRGSSNGYKRLSRRGRVYSTAWQNRNDGIPHRTFLR